MDMRGSVLPWISVVVVASVVLSSCAADAGDRKAGGELDLPEPVVVSAPVPALRVASDHCLQPFAVCEADSPSKPKRAKNVADVDFSGRDLSAVNAEGVKVTEGNFSSSILKQANLANSTMVRPNFAGADLRGADLQGAVWTNPDLRGANLAGANLQGASMPGAQLGPMDCNVPMQDACLTTYDWDTLGSTQRLVPSLPLGTGAAGFAGTGSDPVGSWKFNAPEDVAVTSNSKLVYVADTGNRRVRVINVAAGTVSTLAGTGKRCTFQVSDCGDGGPAAKMELDSPSGLALSPDQSTLFVSDRGAHVVWQIDLNDPSKPATLIAGTGRLGTPEQGEGGAGFDAPLVAPRGLAATTDDLYVADSGTNTVRKISIDDGMITTVAGDLGGAACQELGGAQCGNATQAAGTKLNAPHDVAVTNGQVLIANTGAKSIRAVRDGKIRTLVVDESIRPEFVDVTAHGDAIFGTSTATGGIGRIKKDSLSSETALPANSLFDFYTAGSLPGVNGAAAAPNSRFVVTTRAAANQVIIYGRAVGANIQGANLSFASFGAVDDDGTPRRADWTGIFQQGASMQGLRLPDAKIEYSQFDRVSLADLQGALISDVQLGRVTESDLGEVEFGERVTLDGDQVCLARSDFAASTYTDWQLTNSTMSRLSASNPISFVNPAFDHVDVRRSSATPGITFAGGSIANLTFFEPSTGARSAIAIDRSKVTNSPTTSGGKQADLSKDPDPAMFERLNAVCNVRTNVDSFENQAVSVVTDYQQGGNTSEENRSIVVVGLKTNRQSYIESGTLQLIMPNLRNRASTTTYGKGRPNVNYTVTLRRSGRTIAAGILYPKYPEELKDDYRQSLIQTFDITSAITQRHTDIGRIRNGDHYDIKVTYPNATDEYRTSRAAGTFAPNAVAKVLTRYGAEPKIVTAYREQYDGKYTYVDVVGEAVSDVAALGDPALVSIFKVRQQGQGGQTGGPTVDDMPKVSAWLVNNGAEKQIANSAVLPAIHAQHGYNTSDLSKSAIAAGKVTVPSTSLKMQVVSGCGDCSERSMTRVTEAPTYLIPESIRNIGSGGVPGTTTETTTATSYYLTHLGFKNQNFRATFGYTDLGTFKSYAFDTIRLSGGKTEQVGYAAELERPNGANPGEWQWTITSPLGGSLTVPDTGWSVKLDEKTLSAAFGRMSSNHKITVNYVKREHPSTNASAQISFPKAPVLDAQEVLGKPQNITTSASFDSNAKASLKIRWAEPSAGPKPTKYVVTTSPPTGTCDVDGKAILECLITDNVSEATSYQIQVTSVNQQATPNIHAATTSAYINPYLPWPVSDVRTTLVGVDPGAVAVEWTLPKGTSGLPPSGYRATVQPGGHTCQAEATQASCTITGIPAGSDYTVGVAPLTTPPIDIPETTATSPLTIPALAAPPAPIDVRLKNRATQAGLAQVEVQWSLPHSLMRTDDVMVTTVPESAGCTSSSNNSCMIPELTVGTTYLITVAARNLVGTTSAAPVAHIPDDIELRIAQLEDERDTKIAQMTAEKEPKVDADLAAIADKNAWARYMQFGRGVIASSPTEEFIDSADYAAWGAELIAAVKAAGGWDQFYETLGITPDSPLSGLTDAENVRYSLEFMIELTKSCPFAEPVRSQADLVRAIFGTTSTATAWTEEKDLGRIARYDCIWITAVLAASFTNTLASGLEFNQELFEGRPDPKLAFPNPFSQRIASIAIANQDADAKSSTKDKRAVVQIFEKYDKQIRETLADYNIQIEKTRSGENARQGA